MNRYKHRIAFLCISSSLGGLELSTIRLAQTLNEKSAETLLIVPPFSPLSKRAISENLAVESLKPLIKYGDFFAAVKLALILNKHHIDRLIIMQSGDINLAALAKIFYHPVKIVFYQQMQSSIPKRDFLHTWFYSKLSLWIALTYRMKKDVMNYTKVPEQKISVIPLGQNSQKFDPKLFDPFKDRTYFDLPKDKFIIGMIGRIDRKKGQEFFIRAIPEVIKQSEKILFIIAGEETRGEEGYEKELINLCHELGIEKYVRFLPFTDEVPKLLSSFDIFVMPSDEETFGLIVIEAMAMQKPVIATNAGGVPEIINDERDGLLIPPRDSHSLVIAIQRMLSNNFFRQSISTAAREQATQNFDFNKCVDKIVQSINYL